MLNVILSEQEMSILPYKLPFHHISKGLWKLLDCLFCNYETLRHGWPSMRMASYFCVSFSMTWTICLLSAGEGLLPLTVAVLITGGFFPRGTWKVSGQFCFNDDSVECDGEDKGILDRGRSLGGVNHPVGTGLEGMSSKIYYCEHWIKWLQS